MKHEEADLQTACVSWFRTQYPNYYMLLISSLNGAHLQGNATQRAIKWNRLKQQGAVSGVADLQLLVAKQRGVTFVYPDYYHGCFFELKTTKGKQSPAQAEFQKQVVAQGYEYVIIKDIESFIKKVKEYM